MRRILIIAATIALVAGAVRAEDAPSSNSPPSSERGSNFPTSQRGPAFPANPPNQEPGPSFGTTAPTPEQRSAPLQELPEQRSYPIGRDYYRAQPDRASMVRDPPDAILMVSDALTRLNRQRVYEFAAEHRLPTTYERANYVREGGLSAYSPDLDEIYDRATYLIDRIFFTKVCGRSRPLAFSA
jgi:hypothetical protein